MALRAALSPRAGVGEPAAPSPALRRGGGAPRVVAPGQGDAAPALDPAAAGRRRARAGPSFGKAAADPAVPAAGETRRGLLLDHRLGVPLAAPAAGHVALRGRKATVSSSSAPAGSCDGAMAGRTRWCGCATTSGRCASPAPAPSTSTPASWRRGVPEAVVDASRALRDDYHVTCAVSVVQVATWAAAALLRPRAAGLARGLRLHGRVGQLPRHEARRSSSGGDVLVREADLLIVSGAAAAGRSGRGHNRNTVLARNGADFEHFQKPPADTVCSTDVDASGGRLLRRHRRLVRPRAHGSGSPRERPAVHVRAGRRNLRRRRGGARGAAATCACSASSPTR